MRTNPEKQFPSSHWVHLWRFRLFLLALILRVSSAHSEGDNLTPEHKVNDQAQGWDVVSRGEVSARLNATAMVTDQALLAEIILKDPNSGVRQAAARKLSDQNFVFRVLVESKDPRVIDDIMFSDQSRYWDNAFKQRVALEVRFDRPSAAFSRLVPVYDQKLTTRLALMAKDDKIRCFAFNKLSDSAQGILTEYAANAQNEETQAYASALLRLRSAINAIPGEHRERLGERVFDMVDPLLDPLIASEIGVVVSIKINWSGPTSVYNRVSLNHTFLGDRKVTLTAESLTISVRTSKQRKLISGSWAAKLSPEVDPNEVRESNLLPAPIDEAAFLAKLCERFTKVSIAKLAKESDRPSLRIASIKNLADQTLLAWIAENDRNENVRISAIGKLKNQTVLQKIALNDQDHSVREAAVSRVDSQIMLAEIAINDDHERVRHVAIYTISDRDVLARLATQTVNLSVKANAVSRLASLKRAAKNQR